MKKTVISLAAFALAMTSVNAYAKLNAPTMGVGDTYSTEEALRLTAELIGPGGFIEITMQCDYEVMGEMQITQTKASTDTFTVYHLEGSGPLSGTGNVSISQPIPINGPARIQGGTYESDIYVDSATFATVKKTRRLVGTAEYQLPNGFWFAIGDLTIIENEEYFPPLPEVPFPVAAGDSGSATTNLAAFGSIDAAGLINTELDVPLTINVNYNVTEEVLDGKNTIKVVHRDDANDLTLTVNYDCSVNNTVKYEISGLPLGDNGTLEYVRVNTVASDVAEGSCDSTGPTGPTFNITSPKTNYAAGDTVSWSFSIDNTGNPEYNTDVWLVLELTGQYYFFNYQTNEFKWYPAEGLTFTNRTVAAGSNETFKFLEIPNFPAIGAQISLTWIMGLQNKADGNFWQTFPTVTTTHP